jgi:ribosome-associated protein
MGLPRALRSVSLAKPFTIAQLPAPVRAAVMAADDRKANQIVTIDLRGLSEAADYFIVASGTSDTHVRGVADAIIERLGRLGVEPHHIEGQPSGRWVLLDYVDFVVHLFHPETRAFYQLERLWNDAPSVVYTPAPERKA